MKYLTNGESQPTSAVASKKWIKKVRGMVLGDFPEIVIHRDSKKNPPPKYYGKPITITKIPAGSGKRVWWKCEKGLDHRWQTTVASRTTNSSGCPFCSGQRVCSTNSLRAISPTVSEQWHPIKNKDLTPDLIHAGAHKKVWWKCEVAKDHEWKQSPSVRLHMGTNCPFCSNQKVSTTNSLQNCYPEIAAQWHPTKNGDLSPENTVFGGKKRVWWKCDAADDHEWKAEMYKRTVGNRGCPCCSKPIRKIVPSNSLATTHPNLIAEWDFEKNLKSPSEYSLGSVTKVHWICKEKHKYVSTICNRTGNEHGCPYCSHLKLLPDGSNSLAHLHPDLALEWDYERNKITPWETFPRVTRKAFWICKNEECGNKWKATIASRVVQGVGCSKCAEYGFDPTKPAIYYCLEFWGPNEIWWFKGGISRDIVGRLRNIRRSLRNHKLPLEVKLVEQIEFQSGEEARELELALLEHKEIRVISVEKFDGHTELFSVNPIDFAREQGWI